MVSHKEGKSIFYDDVTGILQGLARCTQFYKITPYNSINEIFSPIIQMVIYIDGNKLKVPQPESA